MEKNQTVNLRDKGMDERIGFSYGGGRSNSKRNPRRMNLPTFPVYRTFEDALKSGNGKYIYTVRTSNPYEGICDGFFPVLYISTPTKDKSIIRKSYHTAVKKFYTSLALINRRQAHMMHNYRDYETNITSKHIFTIGE